MLVSTPGSWVADRLGVERTGVVRVVGLVLAAYGLDLLVTATSRWRRLSTAAVGVVVADLAWVVGTVVVLAAGWVDPRSGRLLLIAAGVAVAGLGVAQRRRSAGPAGRWRSAPTRPSPRRHRRPSRSWSSAEAGCSGRRCGRRFRTTSCSDGWPATSIGVEVVTGTGVDLVHRCVAKGGQAWYETCTLYDEGHRQLVEVDTSDYPPAARR